MLKKVLTYLRLILAMKSVNENKKTKSKLPTLILSCSSVSLVPVLLVNVALSTRTISPSSKWKWYRRAQTTTEACERTRLVL